MNPNSEIEKVIRITNSNNEKNDWNYESGISDPKNQDFKVAHHSNSQNAYFSKSKS